MGEPREQGPGRLRPAVAALLFGGFLLRLFVSLRPLPFLDDLSIPDDAYLSLSLARNLARGLGPLYGLAPTSGFQPLFVLLMAPVYALFPRDPATPVHVALVMLALFDTATLFLVVRLAARPGASRLAPLAAGLAWALSPYAILTCLNGLETSMALCLVAALVAALAGLARDPRRILRARVPFGLGLLAGLAGLARIDALLMLPVIAGCFLRWLGLGPGSRRPLFRALLATAAGALAVYGPWMAWLHHWTGDFLPVSGRAVRYMVLSTVNHHPTFENLYRPMLERAIGVIARRNPVALGLGAPLALGLALFRARLPAGAAGRWTGALLPAAAFGVLLFVAYTGFVFGPWHFARYLFPIALLLVLALAAVLDLCASVFPDRRARLAFGLACLALVAAGSVAQPAFRRMLAPSFGGTWGYMRIGTWARANFPDGTRIGGSQTGALGYFADNLVVVNLDGVVNRDCYEAMRRRRMLDYVRACGIRDLLWQDDIGFIARESAGARPGDVALVRRIEGFSTWGADWFQYRVNPP